MPLITEKAIEITAQKMKFPLRISSVNVTKSLVTFNEEILNGKLHFLCSARQKRRVLDIWKTISALYLTLL